PGNYAILVEDGDEVEEGAPIAKRGDKWIKATKAGRVERQDRSIAVLREKREVREYEVPPTARLRVEGNQRVQAGQQLTEGALNPHKVLQILGRDAVQMYLLEEVQRVYRSQGVNINDKHIEIILRQMLRKVKVRQAGDSLYLMGELVDGIEFAEKNAELRDAGMQTGSAQPILLGITKAALNTESFLSASSFQHTINVLASAAIEGKRDDLHGLKENVIIGKLIPAGTGFRNKKETEEPEMLTVDESGDPEAIQEEQSSQE
ncbi:MAG: DNA-directed RNA polymerase subunit beta', partial [Anaerolineae bacterium]